MVWLTLLAGTGCLAGLTVTWVDEADLHAHAVHAVATVEATGHIGRDESYLIAFTTPDGTPESLWTIFLHYGTHVGDRVAITYDAQRIDNLRQGDGVDRGSVVLPGLFLIPLAMLFLWTSGSALRAEPTGVAHWLLGLDDSSDGDDSALIPAAPSASLSEKKRRRRRKQRAKRLRGTRLDRDRPPTPAG